MPIEASTHTHTTALSCPSRIGSKQNENVQRNSALIYIDFAYNWKCHNGEMVILLFLNIYRLLGSIERDARQDESIFCSIFLVADAPSSKNKFKEEEAEKIQWNGQGPRRLWVKLLFTLPSIKICLSSSMQNNFFMHEKCARRLDGANGVTWYVLMHISLIIVFTYQIQSDMFRMCSRFFAQMRQIVSASAQHLLKSAFLIDRSQSQSQSSQFLQWLTPLTRRLWNEMHFLWTRKTIEEEEEKNLFGLLRCAFSHLPHYLTHSAMPQLCASLNIFLSAFLILRLVYKHSYKRPQSVHSYRSAQSQVINNAISSHICETIVAKSEQKRPDEPSVGSHSWCNKFVKWICMHSTCVNLKTLSYVKLTKSLTQWHVVFRHKKTIPIVRLSRYRRERAFDHRSKENW